MLETFYTITNKNLFFLIKTSHVRFSYKSLSLEDKLGDIRLNESRVKKKIFLRYEILC